MASFVTNQYRGRLSTLDGEPLTVALMDATYIGGADDTDLSSVSGELDVQDAPGYARQTVTGVWDPVDGVLRWDTPPSFDAAGADEIQTILIADINGDIVAGLVWSTPVAGVDDMTPDVEHVAAVADEAGVVARLDDHEVRIVALEQAPGGGGGPAGPSEISELLSTGEPAGLIPVTDGNGAVTLEPVPTGGGGGDVVSEWGGLGTDLVTHAVGSVETVGGVERLILEVSVFWRSMAPIELASGQAILGPIVPAHWPTSTAMTLAPYFDTGGESGVIAVVANDDGDVAVVDPAEMLDDEQVMVGAALGGLRWIVERSVP